MRKFLLVLGVSVFSLLLLGVFGIVACGAPDTAAPAEPFAIEIQSESAAPKSMDERAASALAAPAPARGVLVEREVAREVEVESVATSGQALETAQRKVISTASVTLEVEVVQAAINDVRAIAESLGGFVEHLTSSGDSDRQQATVTIRVPQAQFFPGLERIEALGKVRNRNVGSEDVSEQFIDLNARLKSSLRQEKSLLSLLERAATVTEIVTIERELSRIRSDIERFQGQLNFLERRVDLATITVFLVMPPPEFFEPPSASLSVEVGDVTASVDRVKSLVATLNGALDQVVLSVREDRSKADISMRVFPANFQQTIDFLESEGKVLIKEVREGAPGKGGDTTPAEKPDARIELSLIGDSTGVSIGLIVAIAVPIGVVLLAVFLVILVLRARARI